jgi:hypothetical protein
MLRRDPHRGPRPRIAGRRRLLDPEKKVELCEHVAKGASVEDAAETVCVSLRTVQRERKLDEDFDHELQLSLRQAPDPLKMMQHAARAHWRAAAWLLERTDPEQYAKPAKNSASPAQFDAGLEFVMEAALAAIPPELHEAVYEYMAAAAEEAFACLFPNFGRWGDAKRPKLPPTPLVQQQRCHRHTDPKFCRVIAENELGRIEETIPPQLPAHLQPRVSHKKPEMASPSDIKPAMASPPSAPAGRRHVARGASPWTQPTNHAEPQRGDVAPAFRESRLREVRTARPITPCQPNLSRDNHRLLSPKTRFTTKPCGAAETPAPQNNAPVSREAGAERGGANNATPHATSNFT